MAPLSRRIVLAAAALALAAGRAFAGVPAEAVTGDMSLGNPKARVHVVEYASAACPHCAHFATGIFPAFKAKYIDTGRVYFTLKEFLTPPADVAAAGFLLARCAGRAKYFTVLDAVFRSQADWQEGADVGQIFVAVGQANGLSEAQVRACFTDQAAVDALNKRVVVAVETDMVHATPTFEINGKRIEGGMSLTELDAAIAAAAREPSRRPKRR